MLDFRDVFHSGFRFQKIRGSFSIKDGVAVTRDFSMEGPSAKVRMKGRIDFKDESQNLNVEIFPQLTSAAAVAGAAVVNPAVGIATYVIQKLFGDPVEKIAAKRYRISGNWNKPAVEKLEQTPVRVLEED